MKFRIVSLLRAEFARFSRKMSSFFKRVFGFFRKSEHLDTSRVFIGRFDVLEVFVPILLGDTDHLYVSARMTDELETWKSELKRAHDVYTLRFSLADSSLVQYGWDAVTGIKGRVVGVDVYGTAMSKHATALHDALVKLNDSAVLWKDTGDLEERRKMASFTEEVRKLIKERQEKIGNKKNIISF